MKQGQALYQLQEYELTVISHRKRLKVIKRDLGNNEAIRIAQSAVDDANSILAPLKKKQNEVEWQIETSTEKRQSTEAKLYDGSVTNPKELTDMQNEVASLTRRLEELEEELLVTIDEVEQAQQVLDDATANYDQVAQETAGEQADLLNEKSTLENTIEHLLAKRKAHLPNIEEANLERYNKMRPQKANRPMSALNDNSCSICGVEQIALVIKRIRTTSDLVECTNCGRILVII